LLLHLVDVAPLDDSDPVAAVRGIAEELQRFSPTLAARERWLVLNKVDLLPAEERDTRVRDIVERLQWRGPIYRVAAINGEGTRQLCGDIMTHLEACWATEAEDAEVAEREHLAQAAMQAEARERIQALAEARRAARRALRDGGGDDEGDEAEIEYAP
jgi:GTP-binding protein